MLDLACSSFIFALAAAVGLSYVLRAWLGGRVHHSRLAGEGTVLLGRPIMESVYWSFGPLISLLAALKLTPNMVTGGALLPAFGAGVALAWGHFGVASICASIATAFDILDGLLARRLGTSSDAGEVFDAAVDRYGEFFLFGGLVIYFHASQAAMALTMAALLGGFMVSYATAKAEALNVKPPKGMMRRAERAVYILLAINTMPLWEHFVAKPQDGFAMREAPLLASLALIAVVANVSASRRMYRIAQLVGASPKQ